MGGMQRASSKSGKGSRQRVTERDAREVGATTANQGHRITPFIPFNNTTHKLLTGYR